MDTLGTAQGRTMSDAPAWQLTRLLDGYLVSQLLYVAAELGVADLLAHGSGPGEEIARLVGADAAVLTRVLRGLASEGVLEERDGRFGLSPIGHCLVGLSGAVPPGADAYLLSRVLHDWHDADAARILATCRRAMAGDARLLIVDALLPEDARDHPAAIRMDLHMHILFGARERTEADFRRLLGRAGFRVHGVHVTGSPAGLAVIEARPAQPGVANEVTSSVSSRTP